MSDQDIERMKKEVEFLKEKQALQAQIDELKARDILPRINSWAS